MKKIIARISKIKPGVPAEGRTVFSSAKIRWGAVAGVWLMLLATHEVFATVHEPARTVVITGGERFDSATGRMQPLGAVIIEGDHIRAVFSPGEPWEMPADAKVIDARGRFLIPGLIDGHVHLVHILRALQIPAEELLPLFLAHGVTTVRDVGDEIVAEKLLATHAAAHPGKAPRIFLGSPLIDNNPPYHAWVSWPITDPATVPAFVDELVEQGVQTFKIYVGTTRAVGQAVIREAHRRGRWVTAHLAWGYRAQDAIADGIDSLEHIGSIFDFILPPETPRWPPPSERTALAAAELAGLERKVLEAKASVDLGQPPVTQMIDLLLKQKVAVNPTLVVYRNWMLLRDQPEVLEHADLCLMPARLREGWMRSALASPFPADSVGLRRKQFEKMQKLTGLLYRSGVTLMVGTDTPVQFCPPGAAMHQELELLVESGLSPSAALVAATRNNARSLNQVEVLGAIEAGKLADLVILDADPLVDIRNTRKIFRVVRSGLVLDPLELLRTVPAR